MKILNRLIFGVLICSGRENRVLKRKDEKKFILFKGLKY